MSHFVSTGFAWGFILGFLANRLYCLLHAMWLDRHRPLPDGKHRSKLQAISIDPRAAAALVMILAVGWSLYRTQENTNTSARDPGLPEAAHRRDQPQPGHHRRVQREGQRAEDRARGLAQDPARPAAEHPEPVAQRSGPAAVASSLPAVVTATA